MEDNTNLPVRFLSRLSTLDKNHLGFFVPKYVMDFYNLVPGKYKGGISLSHGEINSCPIQLRDFRHTLRGKLPPNIGKKGAIVEVWIYRDTFTPLK